MQDLALEFDDIMENLDSKEKNKPLKKLNTMHPSPLSTGSNRFGSDIEK